MSTEEPDRATTTTAAAPPAATGDRSAAIEAVSTAVADAVRAELDQVLPHLVTALKRHDAVADLSQRLDRAEKRLADRGQRPLVGQIRRVLTTVRRLDFDPAAKSAILAELEHVLVGSGYTEFGEAGEPFDPTRHEPLAGADDEVVAPLGDASIVAEVYEPGLETLGDVIAKAKVRIGPVDSKERNAEQ
jgi:molecular chaperone GrpE